MVAKDKIQMRELNVDDLCVQRGSKVLLNDLTFSATTGDLIWITGTNGSGKTSLLKCLAGLLLPNNGQVSWQDEQAEIAYLGHIDGHKINLTVLENLEFWHSIYKSSSDLEETMQKLGIWQLRDLAAKKLSAGQSRRVALARLLLKNAKLWLLDEPAAPMDDMGRNLITDIIEDHLANSGIAVIATHSAPQKIGLNAQVLNLSGQADV